MRKELQRIDPLGFSIAREELFIEAYVPFGVDPRCGLSGGPLDGAVDGVIMEVFVDVATVAGDPESGLQLSMYLPRGSEGSEKRYMEG